MKIRLFIMVLLLGTTFVFGAIPKNAATALKDLQRRYKSIKTFRCEFNEQFQWQFTGELVTSNGTIVSDVGDRFRMETPEQVVVCDGTSLYRYNSLKNQVMIEPVKDAANLLPKRLLLDLGSEFEAEAITPISVVGQEGFRLDLKPLKSDESLMSGAVIWVTALDLIVRKMQMDDLNGNRTTYILLQIEIDKPVDLHETTFEIPEGAELFDLR